MVLWQKSAAYDDAAGPVLSGVPSPAWRPFVRLSATTATTSAVVAADYHPGALVTTSNYHVVHTHAHIFSL